MNSVLIQLSQKLCVHQRILYYFQGSFQVTPSTLFMFWEEEEKNEKKEDIFLFYVYSIKGEYYYLNVAKIRILTIQLC